MWSISMIKWIQTSRLSIKNSLSRKHVAKRQESSPGCDPDCRTPTTLPGGTHEGERKFFIDNLLVRIRFIIVLIRWTGLARGKHVRSRVGRTSDEQLPHVGNTSKKDRRAAPAAIPIAEPPPPWKEWGLGIMIWGLGSWSQGLET